MAFLLKIAVFSPMLLINKGLFLIKQNAILLKKKGSFSWPTSNSMKKTIEKVQN